MNSNTTGLTQTISHGRGQTITQSMTQSRLRSKNKTQIISHGGGHSITLSKTQSPRAKRGQTISHGRGQSHFPRWGYFPR